MRIDDNGETISGAGANGVQTEPDETGTQVQLFVYDLTRGLASQFSEPFLGKRLDGIWHTSIVAFSHEYYFGQGIQQAVPYSTHHGRPVRVIDLGVTHIPEDVFLDWLFGLQNKYRPQDYHLLNHNCNHFTSEVARFLVGKDIPREIRDMVSEVLGSPAGAGIRQLVDSFFGGGNPLDFEDAVPLSQVQRPSGQPSSSGPPSDHILDKSSAPQAINIPQILAKPKIPDVPATYLRDLEADNDVISSIESDDWVSLDAGIQELTATLLASWDVHDVDPNLCNLASSLLAKARRLDDSLVTAMSQVLKSLDADVISELTFGMRRSLTTLVASMFSNLEFCRRVFSPRGSETLLDGAVELAVRTMESIESDSNLPQGNKVSTWELTITCLWNIYAVIEQLSTTIPGTLGKQDHWFRAFWATKPDTSLATSAFAHIPSTHKLQYLLTHIRILRHDPSGDCHDVLRDDDLGWKRNMADMWKGMRDQYESVSQWLREGFAADRERWEIVCKDLTMEYKDAHV